MKKFNYKAIRYAGYFVLSVAVLLVPAKKSWSQKSAKQESTKQGMSKADKLATAMTDSLAFLKLTPTQHEQVLAIHKTAVTGYTELDKRADTDTSLYGKKLIKEVLTIHKQKEDALARMLTPEQKDMYQQHKINRLAELQTRLMISELDLTESQIPQVQRLNMKYAPDILEDLQNMQAGKRSAERSLKSNVAEKDKEMKKILSQQQYETFQAYKEIIRQSVIEAMK